MRATASPESRVFTPPWPRTAAWPNPPAGTLPVALPRTVFVVAALLCVATGTARADPLDEVNLRIGTGGSGYGHGATFPGPCVPFGLARPGPDTTSGLIDAPFHHFGGYYDDDRFIRGFSHTRLSGIGVPDYGNLVVLPIADPAADPSADATYRLAFDRASERLRPGSYAVTLKGATEVRVELTASARAALHRYTFGAPGPARLAIDARRAIPREGAAVVALAIDAEAREVSGCLRSRGALSGRGGDGVEVFFSARTRAPWRRAGPIGDAVRPHGAWIELAAGPDQPVELEVGLSFLSVENARAHRRAEVGDRTFEAARDAAEALWRAWLGRIEVEGGSAAARRVFYSALYHAAIMPTDSTERGDVYRGLDAASHAARGRPYYTDLSLWDTYRTQLPLLTLLDPSRSGDVMHSLERMARDGGFLPRWPTAYRYTNCMIGASAEIALADAWVKGIRGFDLEAVYAAARRAALEPTPPGHAFAGRAGIEIYRERGWLPDDAISGSVSRTVEYAYADAALATLAGALGLEEDAKRFAERSQGWRALYDASSGYLRPRKQSGAWVRPFFPAYWHEGYVEGNARQWLWAPVHDLEGLVELLGGRERFAARLEALFEASPRRARAPLPDPHYWHGNQPDIHAAWLFNVVGRPDLAQRWVRWVADERYRDGPDGLAGNDDGGTLSSWYVWASLGLYPISGTPRYLFSTPRFSKMIVRREQGDLTIACDHDPATHPYIAGVTWNEAPLAHPWIAHDRLAGGGTLRFALTREPTSWGRDP